MKKVLLLFLVLISFVLLVSCSNVDNTAVMTDGSQSSDEVIDEGPVKGGTLNLFTTKPDSLNPLVTNNRYVTEFSRLIFETLVTFDEKQRTVPLLAKRWSLSSDGLEWSFVLDDRVFWQDGQPFTADDVAFTMNIILSPETYTLYKSLFKNVRQCYAVDKYTIKVVMEYPDSFLPEKMIFPVLPKHLYGDERNPSRMLTPNPVGTGPYKFVEQTADSIKLTANEKWWKAGENGKNELEMPYISDIVIKIFDNDNNIFELLKNGDIDVFNFEGNGFGYYMGRKDFTVKKYPGKNYEYIVFNVGTPALRDKIVRQALAYAIDVSKLIQDNMPGEALPADIPVIPGSWLNDMSYVSYNANPSKAVEMLVNAGWSRQGDLLRKNIGNYNIPMNFQLLINEENDIRYKIATRIAEYLKPFGIVIEVVKVPWDKEMKFLSNGSFDMALMGCRLTTYPDFSYLYATPQKGEKTNFSGYSNQKVDQLVNQVKTEVDQNQKRLLVFQLKEMLLDELPYLGLYIYNDATVFNKRVRGDLSPLTWNKFNGIEKWYLK